MPRHLTGRRRLLVLFGEYLRDPEGRREVILHVVPILAAVAVFSLLAWGCSQVTQPYQRTDWPTDADMCEIIQSYCTSTTGSF